LEHAHLKWAGFLDHADNKHRKEKVENIRAISRKAEDAQKDSKVRTQVGRFITLFICRLAPLEPSILDSGTLQPVIKISIWSSRLDRLDPSKSNKKISSAYTKEF